MYEHFQGFSHWGSKAYSRTGFGEEGFICKAEVLPQFLELPNVHGSEKSSLKMLWCLVYEEE